MNDYGKAAQHLTRTGRAWNHPGKVTKLPARVPDAWTDNPSAWEGCMRELGFDWCDDNRWCATETPTPGKFGWCAIVALETSDRAITQGRPMFVLHLTVDTVDNEQTSPWVYPDDCWNTPLEAAQAAMKMFGGLR